jgi:hypothetical protein
MAQERSLGDYLRPLGKHSLLIILLVLIAAAGGLIVAAILSGSQPYQAQAIIVYKNSDRITLTGAPDFRDTTVTDPNRPQKLKLLAGSVDVAAKVKAEAATQTQPDIRAFGTRDLVSLQNAVTVDARGDLVYVQAQAATVPAATWLANTWAGAAMAKINQVYGASSDNVEQALTQAKTDLDADEQALQQFLATSRIDSLTQELTQTQKFLETASAGLTAGQLTLYSTSRDAIQRNLQVSYSMVYTLDQHLSDLSALRTRIEQGPDTGDALYSNQVALLVLLSKIVAGSQGPQVQFQLSAADSGRAPPTKADQLNEVDSTTAAVQKLQSDLRAQIRDQEAALSAPPPTAAANGANSVPATLQAPLKRMNELQSQIEQLTFQRSQLQRTRDLQQTSYDLLRSRLAEQQVNGVISSVVDLGSGASDDATAQSRSPVRMMALLGGAAALIAAVLGIILAYGLSLLRPNFSSNASITARFRRSAA